MPMPVSRTSKRTSTRPAVCCNCSARRRTQPLSVNLTALDKRLSRACDRRVASPRRRCGRWSASSTSSRPFWPARSATIAPQRASSASTENTASSSASLPASILDRSRMSLMSCSRCWAAVVSLSMRSRARPSWQSRRIRWARPMMAFIGVRISWLMLARKALLARLAASAASRASRSASAACFCSVLSMAITTRPTTTPSRQSGRQCTWAHCRVPSCAMSARSKCWAWPASATPRSGAQALSSRCGTSSDGKRPSVVSGLRPYQSYQARLA